MSKNLCEFCKQEECVCGARSYIPKNETKRCCQDCGSPTKYIITDKKHDSASGKLVNGRVYEMCNEDIWHLGNGKRIRGGEARKAISNFSKE